MHKSFDSLREMCKRESLKYGTEREREKKRGEGGGREGEREEKVTYIEGAVDFAFNKVVFFEKC
jgi:hypothetical protein